MRVALDEWIDESCWQRWFDHDNAVARDSSTSTNIEERNTPPIAIPPPPPPPPSTAQPPDTAVATPPHEESSLSTNANLALIFLFLFLKQTPFFFCNCCCTIFFWASPSNMYSVLAFAAVSMVADYPANTVYSYHGCLPGSAGATMQWCNFSLSHTVRLKSLLKGIIHL